MWNLVFYNVTISALHAILVGTCEGQQQYMDLFRVLKLTSFQIAAMNEFLIAGVLIKLL
jgi:hypothetical protein